MSMVHGAQLKASPPEVGEAVRAVDVSGSPGLPIIDGRNLVNVQAGGEQRVGQHQFGALTSYGADANMLASTIQYSRVFLTEGITLTSMKAYRTTGGSPSRHVRMAVYDQVDPEALNGVPNEKLAETAETDTTGTDSYIEPALTSPLAITVTGFYWLAFVVDTATPLRFQVTDGSFPPGFANIWREMTTGTTLPAIAGGLTNPQSAIVFVASVE